jgi:hypothetical protein
MKNIYIYICKLLLNIVVTAGIKALVLGNKFLYACVKDICHVLAQPHFDTINSLLLKHCDPNQFFMG